MLNKQEVDSCVIVVDGYMLTKQEVDSCVIVIDGYMLTKQEINSCVLEMGKLTPARETVAAHSFQRFTMYIFYFILFLVVTCYYNV
jgi:hypothetical protein